MTKIDIYKDKAGEWRWRIIHANGNIMADSSEGYKNKADCVSSLDSVSKFMAAREIATIKTNNCDYCKSMEEGQLNFCGICGQRLREKE